jgi:hypothetical protein
MEMKKPKLTPREVAAMIRDDVPREWILYCTSGEKPDAIPARPDLVYADSGWNGWDDFLSHCTTANGVRR